MRSSIFMVMILLQLASCVVCLFLLMPMAKFSKQYQAFLSRLKDQGQYEAWAEENKTLVFLANVYRYVGVSVILFVLMGLVFQFVALPQMAVMVLGSIAYLYWPALLIFLIMLSRLRKKVPKPDSQVSN